MPSPQIPKLNDDNYFDWAELMEALLVKLDLWVTITEIPPTGSPNSKAVRDFNMKQQKARAELKLNVEPRQLPHTRFDTPKEIWENLERVHRAKGFASRLSLLRRFHGMVKDDEQTMSSWVADVRELAHRIKQTGFELQDEHVILVLTQGLDESYHPLIIVLDSALPEELTMDSVITRLINEESRRSVKVAEFGASALTAYDKGKQGKQGKNVMCFNCGKKGHYANKCPEKSGEEANVLSEDLFAF
jgi:gag-polypeptide of LTR copia-type/Zinc knuckle